MSLKNFDMAAAGHVGIMTNEDESLFFKPALQQELTFYNTVKAQNDKNDNLLSPDAQQISDLSPIDEWMPKYVGSMQKASQVSEKDIETLGETIKTEAEIKQIVGNGTSEDQYIVLENLLNGYKSPNVMDIKLGRILYDKTATEDKKNRLMKVSNETTSGSLGFRICGIKMVNNQKTNYNIFLPTDFANQGDESYISINKKFGRRLQTEMDVKSSLQVFFSNHECGVEYFASLIKIFLERIDALIDTLNNSRANFISSSILLIFESDTERIIEHGIEDVLIDSDFDIISYMEEITDPTDTVEIDGEEIDLQTLKQQLSLSKLKLVDFGHSKVTKDTTTKGDPNTVTGLYSLKKIFQEILNEI